MATIYSKVILAGFLMSLAYASSYTRPDVARFFPTRIVGGHEAPPGFAPYMMALVLGVQVKTFICGASVLNRRATLTAAHCIDSLLQFTGKIPKSTRGVHSSRNWKSASHEVEFSSFKQHPLYDKWSIKYDVAVLIAERDIEFTDLVQPIQLSFKWVGGGRHIYLTGWGLTGDPKNNGENALHLLPDKLQVLFMRTISPRSCMEAVNTATVKWGPAPALRPDLELCTQHSPEHGACMGDSGSAIVLARTRHQVGVVSWGFRCSVGAPSMNTRISAVKDFLLPYLHKYGTQTQTTDYVDESHRPVSVVKVTVEEWPKKTGFHKRWSHSLLTVNVSRGVLIEVGL